MTMSGNDALAAQWPFREKPIRRCVVKVGSNLLARPEGGLELERMRAICQDLAAIRRSGADVILVTSGAVAAGRGILGFETRPSNIPELQAAASAGQGILIETYNSFLRPEGYAAAQLLLNRDDLQDRRRYLNARSALATLLQYDVIPIVNENDSVTIDELKFGDNDMLSAMVAAKMDADLLIILTNVPGLMSGHPVRDPAARLIPVVKTIDPAIRALVTGERSGHGTGGMATKLDAAAHACDFGVTCVVADGRRPEKLRRIFSGDFQGTLFLPDSERRAGDSRRHWIQAQRAKGSVTIDSGAERAVLSDGKSLLPVGVTSVQGAFQEGEIIAVKNAEGERIAQGITNYNSDTLSQIAGKRTREIEELIGSAFYKEAIHRNHLVILRSRLETRD